MQYPITFFRSRPAVWIIVVLCLPTPRAATGTDPPIEAAAPDVEWDAVFSRTEGWTGGDVAGTVDLGDGRTLWVFGDSWIGNVAEGKHAPGSHMINNAIGVHRGSPLGPGRAPRYREIEFFWGPDDQEKKPTAWVVPPQQATSQWYWTNGGGIVLPGPNGQPRLIVFLFHLTKRGGEENAWNFKHIGSAMAIVDNVRQPAGEWKVRLLPIPNGIGTDRPGAEDAARETNWGVAASLRQEQHEDGTRTCLYLYGVNDTQPMNKRLLLARVAAEEVEQFDRWRFYAGEDRWSPRVAEAVPIAERLSSELSVDEHIEQGRGTYLMVYSEPLFGRRILVRTSPRPEGPWSEPTPVYTVPGLDRGKEYFTYAAKGHLHLSRPNELLVTYIINANNIWDMASDAAIYRPRFVRVPLDRILPPAGDHGE